METFFVYILQSKRHARFYTGMSNNPDSRLITHNLGLTKSTKSGRPWGIIWISEPMTKSEALALERKIKKRGAKRFLQDNQFLNA